MICCLVVKSCLTLCDPMDYIAHQSLLFMIFPRQEYWSGLLFPPPEDLHDPGIKLTSLILVDGFFMAEPPGKPI